MPKTNLMVDFATSLAFIIHDIIEHTLETLFGPFEDQHEPKYSHIRNSLFQAMLVDNLDLIQLLIIDRQDNAPDGFEKKQSIRTHFAGEGIERVSNIIFSGLRFGNLTATSLRGIPER